MYTKLRFRSSAVSEYCVFSVSPDLEVCFSDRLKTTQQLTYINSFLEKFQYAKKKGVHADAGPHGFGFCLKYFGLRLAVKLKSPCEYFGF